MPHDGAKGKQVGPDLTQTAIRIAAWMIAHFKRPQAMVPGSSMPPIQLSDSQLNALAAFLLKLNANGMPEALQSAPEFAVEGAMIYQQNRCGVCHQVNGIGDEDGSAAERAGREAVARMGGGAFRRAAEAVAGHR